jgi:hypothetical protein
MNVQEKQIEFLGRQILPARLAFRSEERTSSIWKWVSLKI